jgi:hypothetical protein
MSHELLVRHTSRLLKKALREKNRQDARTAK